MKWALLVFMISTFPEPNVQLAKTLEMETESLCKKAQQVFLSENKSMSEGMDSILFGYKTICVQVRE